MATATLRRAKEDTIDGLRAALAGLYEQRADAEHRVADETARRSALLLSGSAAEIRDSEETARLLRIDIERLVAQAEGLAGKLSVANGRVVLAELERLRDQAEDAAQKFIDFWRNEYEGLARRIAGGLQLEAAAVAAVGAYNRAVGVANAESDVQAAGGVPSHTIPDLPRAYAFGAMKSPTLLVCLPSVDRGPAIAWPDGHSLDRPQVSGEAAVYAR